MRRTSEILREQQMNAIAEASMPSSSTPVSVILHRRACEIAQLYCMKGATPALLMLRETQRQYQFTSVDNAMFADTMQNRVRAIVANSPSPSAIVGLPPLEVASYRDGRNYSEKGWFWSRVRVAPERYQEERVEFGTEFESLDAAVLCGLDRFQVTPIERATTSAQHVDMSADAEFDSLSYS